MLSASVSNRIHHFDLTSHIMRSAVCLLASRKRRVASEAYLGSASKGRHGKHAVMLMIPGVHPGTHFSFWSVVLLERWKSLVCNTYSWMPLKQPIHLRDILQSGSASIAQGPFPKCQPCFLWITLLVARHYAAHFDSMKSRTARNVQILCGPD